MANPRRPNILLILSDQEQHWSLLPASLQRPGLEWLLEHGTGFTAHHVVTLPCGPSRATIYTGQHTTHTGVITNPGSHGHPGLSPHIPTIGTMLREHGYHTAYKGKWHVSVIEPPARFSASTVDALEPFGFAEYTADGDPVGIPWDGFRQDPAIAADAANWLLGRGGHKPADAPWLLAVNFVNPHDVMFFDATGGMNDTRSDRLPVPRLPAPSATGYEREWDVPLPISFAEDLSSKPASQTLQARAIESWLGALPHTDEAAWRALRSYYFNCLADLDRNLDTLLRALVVSGHDRDTVVIYTTDHGEAAGAHGLREKPTSVYREVVNVPLVVAHPDHAGARMIDALSSSVDIAPTVLALAGVGAAERAERHPALHGHDLLPALDSVAGRSGRDDAGALFCMDRPSIEGDTPRVSMRGIHDGRWKFARYFAPGDVRAGEPDELRTRNDLELYDTRTDPEELHNLADRPEHHGEVQRLVGRLDALISNEIGAVVPAKVDRRPGCGRATGE